MCKRHSFVITRAGKVLDGMGLTDSHTTIMDLHGLEAAQHDTCNLYEWQPPKGWPETSWFDGLKVDTQVFEPKSSHDKAAEKHLLAKYPTLAAWEAVDTIDPALDGKTVNLSGSEITVYCSGVHEVTSGRVLCQNSTVTAWENSTVTARENSTVTAWDNSTVTAWDNSTVRAWDNSTVTAWENSTATLLDAWWCAANQGAQVFESAVIIDRLNGGIAVYTARDITSEVL
jgi:hypothetical protein